MLFAPPYGLDGPQSRCEQRVVRFSQTSLFYQNFRKSQEFFWTKIGKYGFGMYKKRHDPHYECVRTNKSLNVKVHEACARTSSPPQEAKALRGVTFLSLNKKVTKKVSLGESAQASWRQFAPSPKNPSRNLSCG